MECMVNYRYPQKAETMINQENENPIHDEFSHGPRAFEYYCWNLTGGKAGGVGKTEEGVKRNVMPAVMKDGRQVSVDIGKFGDAATKFTRSQR